ncbi:RpiB/LacA/LacB family sugar-phosphate isomerase [Enterocloster bolteae]|jgi:ribose 5-phosphate isomerase B|uniref:RpiB/LacA/LacB family sugar-phosphate isomerase n=1 Tax=Clostridia TaxID=186801 RepID=UPI001106FC2B|nr:MULTISPECIES: RpiB/LacA/LacB family sugar-phosphate isomerase [Clostridia]MCB7093020.1 RpiB/LacA/LacB family sugar-phosphate isomerase [Enterocloster bolteae]
MRVVLASDRNGLDYKLRLISHLQKNGYEPVDVGTYNNVPCDTPVFAAKAARLVASGDCKYGVLLCATGTGMIMAANKIKGILCGMGYADLVTKYMRQHNDANMIAFGQKHMGYEDVEHRVDIFLTTEFIGQHHTPRVQQIRELEEGKEIKQTPIMNPNWK